MRRVRVDWQVAPALALFAVAFVPLLLAGLTPVAAFWIAWVAFLAGSLLGS